MKWSRDVALCFAALLCVTPLFPVDAAALRVRDITFPAGVASSAAARVRAAQASRSNIGSMNTVTADAPVPRPDDVPCVDILFSNQTFAQYAGVPFTYAPPAHCPGPYAKIVFNGNFSVSAGIQFDRTASIQLGNVPVYFGTTAEPDTMLAPSWHVERDVTDDAALLASPQAGEADIYNIVNSTYTGIISGTAFLQFYRAKPGIPAASPPDIVLPFPGVAGGPQALDTGTSTLTATYSFPANIDRAYLDVYAQSQQTDEQYFLCAPNNVAAELFACGNTALRETEVSIDGTPAGVAPVTPWIYTGGLDPYLWAPIPGAQTLEFEPYRVDLTPFAGQLDNGKPHTVALSVDNADNYFQAIATLFAYEDHNVKHLSGALTTDTLTTNPQPTVVEHLRGSSPSVDGTIAVSNTRNYVIAGYLNTPSGRVTTTLTGSIAFANGQTYANESAITGTLVINQSTIATTTVATFGAGSFDLRRSFVSYPLSVSLVDVLNSAGTGTQVTNIDQHFEKEFSEIGTLRGVYASFESNEVTPQDTLDILDDEFITGNAGQASAQTYTAFDTLGTCYAQTIKAANNIVTSVSTPICDRGLAARTLQPLLTR